MPHLQKLYEELKGRGLEIVAVNVGDPQERVRDYMSSSKFTFAVLLTGEGSTNAIIPAYRLKAYPTNYLVDIEGKVLWRNVGFDIEALRKALNAAGF